MPNVTVAASEIEIPAGATVLQTCERAGNGIPRFCYDERRLSGRGGGLLEAAP
jgi:NADH dehydrogenase/NADH:ubiquinone oxidoreductase subunit G